MMSSDHQKRTVKHISARCPNCGIYSLKHINKKFQAKRTFYKLVCPECEYQFTFSRSPDFWRILKKKYKLTPRELWGLRSSFLESLFYLDDQGNVGLDEKKCAEMKRLINHANPTLVRDGNNILIDHYSFKMIINEP